MYVYVYVCLYKQMCLAIDRIIFVSFLCCFCFSLLMDDNLATYYSELSLKEGIDIGLVVGGNDLINTS